MLVFLFATITAILYLAYVNFSVI